MHMLWNGEETRFILRTLLLFILLVQLSCTKELVQDSAPIKNQESASAENIPDAVPRVEPLSKYGNPDSYIVFGKRYHVMQNSKGFKQKGIASWYGKKFHGRKTSNQETYDMYAMTAAHKSLPLPTYVEVTNLKNAKKIIVRINDRGPFHENRIIDLSYTAAQKLDIVKNGTGLVEIRVLNPEVVKENQIDVMETESTQAMAVDKVSDGFYIQVGAFEKSENASRFKQRLTSLSIINVEINEVSVDNRKIHRVQIGPLDNIESADKIVEILGGAGLNEHRIVVR
jgi:rare lipoprotein A